MRTGSMAGLLCCIALVSVCRVPLVHSDELSSQDSKRDLVFLHATVQNKEGAFAVGLNRSFFTVKSRDETEDIAYFSSQASATSIVLLIDVSGSMKYVMQSWLRPALDGLATFLHANKGTNEYLLVFFAAEPTVAVDWTTDTARVLEALNKSATKRLMDTALYDSCEMAIEGLSRRDSPRRVIILVTDGEENASRTENSKIKEALKKTDILVYSVSRRGIMDSLSSYAHTILNEFSIITGGAAFVTSRPSEISGAFEGIASQLQHQYRIGFYPRTLDTKWHPLEVSVTLPPKDSSSKPQRLFVHTRQGYYATRSH